MPLSPEKISDLKLKHLEMIQGLVSRMAGYGATFKSYCITVATAVVGFAVSLQRPAVVFLALFPILTFALVDAQYLRVERRFRKLYDVERKKDWGSVPEFAIDLKSAPPVGYLGTLFSWSIIGFYGPIAVLVVVVMLFTRFGYGL